MTDNNKLKCWRVTVEGATGAADARRSKDILKIRPQALADWYGSGKLSEGSCGVVMAKSLREVSKRHIGFV